MRITKPILILLLAITHLLSMSCSNSSKGKAVDESAQNNAGVPQDSDQNSAQTDDQTEPSQGSKKNKAIDRATMVFSRKRLVIFRKRFTPF
jgi:hypothetical protein